MRLMRWFTLKRCGYLTIVSLRGALGYWILVRNKSVSPGTSRKDTSQQAISDKRGSVCQRQRFYVYKFLPSDFIVHKLSVCMLSHSLQKLLLLSIEKFSGRVDEFEFLIPLALYPPEGGPIFMYKTIHTLDLV